jgi:putative ABC transport system permease protein
MIKNYFKTAWRNLERNKVFSFINLFGLSLGLACSMLILLYVKDETSFDKFHKNVNNIYRVVLKSTFNGKEREGANTGFFQGPRFTENVSGIKTFVRFQKTEEDVKNGNYVQSQQMFRVDSNFFSVFTFPLKYGDPETCLIEPHSVVLSEDEAMKQFGTTDAIGKMLMLKEDSTFVPYKVTAVAKRCPQNSSIRFDVLLPFKESAAQAKNNDSWFMYFLTTFVVLHKNADLQTVEKQMQRYYVSNASDAFAVMLEKLGLEAGTLSMDTYSLQPFTDIHLDTKLPANNGLKAASNPIYSYILSGIALFVLLIACINFINMTITLSLKRAKEIGIRKVLGSNRKQLIKQFLGESFLLCFIAFIIALLLTNLVLPLFNTFANKELSFSYLLDPKLITGFILLFILTGLIAGFYPALVLSNFDPVKILYKRFNISGKNYLQKTLIVLQFTLASFFIISTFIVYIQFNHLTKANLGYDDTDLVLVNKNTNDINDAVFENKLLKNPNIVGISAANSGNWSLTAKDNANNILQFAYKTIDENYLPLLKIPLIAGRNFSTAFPSDSNSSVLVNEAFVKSAGWKNPIGETVKLITDTNGNRIFYVIGVVKDYHYASLNEKIGPQLFAMKNSDLYGTFYIKVKPGTESESLKFIQKSFSQIFPLIPYSYTFLSDDNRQQYKDLAKWKEIILFTAILTILISCIGLFGLSVLSAEKRTKEIGIRKVLGASVQDIVTTLSKDFLRLVGIALFISMPFAWIASNKWLQKYAYRISLNWELFAGVALLIIVIAFITVSFQSIKTAMANPAHSLRSE